MRLVRIGLLPLLLACLTLGLHASCQTDAAPVLPPEPGWPADEWPVSTPAAEGIDPAAVDSLHADIVAGEYGLVDHFLLIRHGRIVADHHYEHDYDAIAAEYDTTNHQYNYDHPDWHPLYRDTHLHTLQSVTKSVTSAALGIALDEGHLEGVDIPVMSMFDAYNPDFSDPRRTAMTLEDMLTISWPSSTPGTSTVGPSSLRDVPSKNVSSWLPNAE